MYVRCAEREEAPVFVEPGEREGGAEGAPPTNTSRYPNPPMTTHPRLTPKKQRKQNNLQPSTPQQLRLPHPSFSYPSALNSKLLGEHTPTPSSSPAVTTPDTPPPAAVPWPGGSGAKCPLYPTPYPRPTSSIPTLPRPLTRAPLFTRHASCQESSQGGLAALWLTC